MAQEDSNTGGSNKKHTGKCKRFNPEKGFGFISVDDDSGDVFVHQTEIKADGYRTLHEGEELEFEIVVQDDGRRKAINVTGPGGGYVRGGFSSKRGRGGGGYGGGGYRGRGGYGYGGGGGYRGGGRGGYRGGRGGYNNYNRGGYNNNYNNNQGGYGGGGGYNNNYNNNRGGGGFGGGGFNNNNNNNNNNGGGY